MDRLSYWQRKIMVAIVFVISGTPFSVEAITPKIVAGSSHSVGLKSDGTVIAWGANLSGQCDIPDDLVEVIDISAGRDHTAALKANGTVVVWGNNTYGERNVPVGLTNVIAITSGLDHILALKADKTVVAWGKATWGVSSVPSGLSNVKAISASYDTSMALKSDGTVVMWGENSAGQCNVPAGLSSVIGITAGHGNSHAVKSDGTIESWGSNNYGSLDVPPALSSVIAIEATLHVIALKTNNTVTMWGRNVYGQTTPPPGLSNVVVIAAGDEFSLALLKDGTIVGWGTNAYGQCSAPSGLFVNNAPIDLILSNTSVYENQPAGTTVGLFNTIDPDLNNTYSYSLVAGSGSLDNTLFTINGSNLHTSASLNYEENNSYSIRVRTTDQGGLWTEKEFTISVSNIVGEYSLAVTAVNGTVAKDPDEAFYDEGALVSLTATANSRYRFVSWSGDATGSNNPLNVAITTNKSLTATFVLDDFTLTVTSLYGTVTQAPNISYYDNGTVVTLTATPKAAYYFSGWAGDLMGTNNPSTIVMNSDKSITANYGPIAPEILPPKTIGRKNFTARWKWVEDGASEGELSVVLVVNEFPEFVPGYEYRYVANSPECIVTNLLANKDYWYRVRRLMPDGCPSPWSSQMKVRTGKGIPVFNRLLSDVPVSKGISQEFAVSNLVAGTGTLRVKSSNTNAVKATVSSGVLTLQYLWKATSAAKVIMTLTHPVTGYKASYRVAVSRAAGAVAILGQSALTNAGTRVAQDLTLGNRTGGTVYGVRVRALGLEQQGWLVNRTGLDPVSKAAFREIPCVLPAGSQMVVRLVYSIAYKKQAKTDPVAYGAWAIMPPVSGVGPVSKEMTISQQDLYDGLWLLGLSANRNRLYRVYHSDDDGATWMLNVPIIRATANYLMWLDTDEGAPENRLYKVVDAGI